MNYNNDKGSAEIRKYIVVKLGNEQFGIDISFVENIVRMPMITRVPKAQWNYKGVINIRGEIIPVMSLRLKFGLEDDEYTANSRILILKLEPQTSGNSGKVGIIVDEVSEVVDLDERHIDKASGSISNDDKAASFISGVGKYADSLISLLNITDVIIEKDSVA